MNTMNFSKAVVRLSLLAVLCTVPVATTLAATNPASQDNKTEDWKHALVKSVNEQSVSFKKKKKSLIPYKIEDAPLLTGAVESEYRKINSTKVLEKNEYVRFAQKVLEESIKYVAKDDKRTVAKEHAFLVKKNGITDYLLVLERVLALHKFTVKEALKKIMGIKNPYELIPSITAAITETHFCEKKEMSRIIDTRYNAEYPFLKALVIEEMKNSKRFDEKAFQSKIANTLTHFLTSYSKEPAARVLNAKGKIKRSRKKGNAALNIMPYKPSMLFLMLIEQHAHSKSLTALLEDTYQAGCPKMQSQNEMDDDDTDDDLTDKGGNDTGNFQPVYISPQDSNLLAKTRSNSEDIESLQFIELVEHNNDLPDTARSNTAKFQFVGIGTSDNDEHKANFSDSQQEDNEVQSMQSTPAGSPNPATHNKVDKLPKTSSNESLTHVNISSATPTASLSPHTPKKQNKKLNKRRTADDTLNASLQESNNLAARRVSDTKSLQFIEIGTSDNEDEANFSDSQREDHEIQNMQPTPAGSTSLETSKGIYKLPKTTSTGSLTHLNVSSITSTASPSSHTTKKQNKKLNRSRTADDTLNPSLPESNKSVKKSFFPTLKTKITKKEPLPSLKEYKTTDGTLNPSRRERKRSEKPPFFPTLNVDITEKEPHTNLAEKLNHDDAARLESDDQSDVNSVLKEGGERWKHIKNGVVIFTAAGCVVAAVKATKIFRARSGKPNKPTRRVVEVS